MTDNKDYSPLKKPILAKDLEVTGANDLGHEYPSDLVRHVLGPYNTLQDFAKYVELNEPGEVLTPWGIHQEGHFTPLHDNIETDYPFLVLPTGYTIEAVLDERLGMQMDSDEEFMAFMDKPGIKDQIDDLVRMVTKIVIEHVAEFGEDE